MLLHHGAMILRARCRARRTRCSPIAGKCGGCSAFLTRVLSLFPLSLDPLFRRLVEKSLTGACRILGQTKLTLFRSFIRSRYAHPFGELRQPFRPLFRCFNRPPQPIAGDTHPFGELRQPHRPLFRCFHGTPQAFPGGTPSPPYAFLQVTLVLAPSSVAFRIFGQPALVLLGHFKRRIPLHPHSILFLRFRGSFPSHPLGVLGHTLTALLFRLRGTLLAHPFSVAGQSFRSCLFAFVQKPLLVFGQSVWLAVVAQRLLGATCAVAGAGLLGLLLLDRCGHISSTRLLFKLIVVRICLEKSIHISTRSSSNIPMFAIVRGVS
uniref:Uncharacterized protein n=1 Tax=Anopheles atroparvus TaxID=41427 RepID=A0AAG5CTK5_ANOAO